MMIPDVKNYKLFYGHYPVMRKCGYFLFKDVFFLSNNDKLSFIKRLLGYANNTKYNGVGTNYDSF